QKRTRVMLVHKQEKQLLTTNTYSLNVIPVVKVMPGRLSA
ncbi:hypothetical protein ECOSU61_13888, partial [Escherichia coli O157:H7 str. LSU-61]